jgi:hypothetical protein
LDYSVKVLEVFPNETTDSRIGFDGFVRAIFLDIASGWSFDRNIVDVRNRDVRNLGL